MGSKHRRSACHCPKDWRCGAKGVTGIEEFVSMYDTSRLIFLQRGRSLEHG